MRDKLSVLGWVLAGLCVAMAVAEVVLSEDGGVVRGAFLGVAAVLVVGGIRLLDRWPWPGAVVASVGALLAGMSLIWILIPLPLAVAIVVLSLSKARASGQKVPVSAPTH